MIRFIACSLIVIILAVTPTIITTAQLLITTIHTTGMLIVIISPATATVVQPHVPKPMPTAQVPFHETLICTRPAAVCQAQHEALCYTKPEAINYSRL
jgi:hypothetical protein